MEINSINAHLTNSDHEKAQRFDIRASDLEIISAGGAFIVLSRGERAVQVFSALRPLLGEITLTPVAIEDAPPPRKVVPVTTGVRSAGGS